MERLMINELVEWTEDCRPMPDDCYGADELLSDMSLIFKRQGKAIAIFRTFMGNYKVLINHDNKIIEKDLEELKIIKQ